MARVSENRRCAILEAYGGWRGTQKEFCERHSVPISTLQWWMRRHRRGATTRGFVEVTTDASQTASSGSVMVVRFGRAELIVHEVPPAQWLAEFVGHLA